MGLMNDTRAANQLLVSPSQPQADSRLYKGDKFDVLCIDNYEGRKGGRCKRKV